MPQTPDLRLPTRIADRPADALDAHLISCVGLVSGAHPVRWAVSEGLCSVELGDVLARALSMCEEDDGTLEIWLELACAGLEEDCVALLGSQWRAEIELGLEVLMCERSAELREMALSASTVLRYRDQHPAVVAAACMPMAMMARLVG